MKYREILELYKEGKLTPEEKEKIEQDIEKQEAIEEFIYSGYSEKEEKNDEIADEGDVSAEVGKRIRKSFRKRTIGIIICIIAVVAMFQWVLPSATNIFWYDATDEVQMDGYTTYRFSKDMRVYSELFLTKGHISTANVTPEGYGRYSFECYANGNAYSTKIIAGEITRGRITAYLPEWLDRSYGNAFSWTYNMAEEGQRLSEMNLETETQYYESREDNVKDLRALASDEEHFAFISFDRLMTYDEAIALAEEIGDEDVWVAVYCGDNAYYSVENFGMYPSSLDMEKDQNVTPEEHFTGMLKYMGENEEFAEMWLGGGMDSVLDVSKALAYIDEKGLQSYGIAVYTDRDTLLKLMDNQDIFSIMPDRYRFE